MGDLPFGLSIHRGSGVSTGFLELVLKGWEIEVNYFVTDHFGGGRPEAHIR